MAKNKAQVRPAAETQAENLRDVTAPRLDLIFSVYRNQFLSLDAEGTPLAVIHCRLRETAAKYASHQSPDHDRVVNVAEHLTAKLWSRESRAKLARLMLRPILHSKSGGVIGWTDKMGLQHARQAIARDLVAGHQRIVEESKLPVLTPRTEPAETPTERRKRNQEEQGYADYERNLAEGLERKPEDRRRFFGSIVDDIAGRFKPKADAPAEPGEQDQQWVERFGESRDSYVARLQEHGLDPIRLAKRVAEREAQMGGAA